MRIDINEYRINKIPIIEIYKKTGVDGVSTACASISCPIVAAFYYCAEEFGMSEELKSRIEVLTKFYGYETIVGYETKQGQGDVKDVPEIM